MTTNPAAAQDPTAPRTRPPALTISDLARRTGLSTAVLRTWETRHDFPRPTRLESGHRRYGEGDVALVEEVLRRRDAGVRLEVAIADVRGRLEDAPPAPSVFATLRRTQPHLHPQALRKSTLLALSWAIEDECAARAQRPLLYGAFQHARFFGRSTSRWTELARTSRETTVFADLDGLDGPGAQAPGVRLVHLPEDAPMRREWVVVCDAEDHPACLSAWELPGQDGVPDPDRLFESVWTLEPAAVREAARACAALTAALDPDGPPPVQPVTPVAGPASADLRAATTLFTRLMAYVDRLS